MDVGRKLRVGKRSSVYMVLGEDSQEEEDESKRRS